MLSRTFKCLFKVYFGEVTLRNAGRASTAAVPLGEAISPLPRLEPTRAELPHLGKLHPMTASPQGLSRGCWEMSHFYM